MSGTVIKVEHLSKKYMLSHQRQEKYTALRDVIVRGVKSLGKKMISPFTSSDAISPGSTQEEFYALKDISFEIKQGDRVGIIGRNGAGKSTLLKVLSRITEPTSGRIELTGRVASLLEVGTGFHPELTGRENIYLNGAILGMGRAEIKRKFDEIVDFAEVERFLDTPVKRYSSGMYVRLAFAVAAHLEPEILIVDEVLAVGDAQFQKKCLGKMEEVGKAGRTVLFVSHNVGAISQLCSTGVLLEAGNILAEGNVKGVISHYLFSADSKYKGEVCWPDEAMPGDNDLKLKRVSVAQQNVTSPNLQDDIGINIEIELESKAELNDVVLGLIIYNSKGEGVLHTASNINVGTHAIKRGITIYCYSLPPLLLSQGNYTVTVGASVPNAHTYFLERDIINFYIETCNPEVNRYPTDAWKGILNPQIGQWNVIDLVGKG